MADRRYSDRNSQDRRRVNIEDDYLELLSDYGEDEFEDVFSDSSKDVYIGRTKNKQNESTDDIYISGRRKNTYQDVYSQSERRNPPESQRRQADSTVRRTQQPTSPQAPPRRASDKYNTQQVRKVSAFDNDEISDYEARHGKNASNGGKKRNKGFIAFCVVLAVIVGFGGIFFIAANGIVGKFEKADEIEHIEDVDSLVSESYVKNILLIGADKEKGGASRSDSIMIASVNKRTGKITVVSILRDTHLDIPGNRESKVNAAYAWGGANLLVQTTEQNFGIKIDDYATVNFEMFTALIDGLGGVEVDVTEDEADYINNRHRYGKEEKPETVPSGENVHLTGYQALWYARIRKLDSDFNRTERQRKVISAIVKDVKGKLNPIGVFGLISTAKEVAPYIETTLSVTDFWGLVFGLMTCVVKSGSNMDNLLVSAQLPFEDTWWYSSEWDGSSISIDLEENRELLYKLLYEEHAEESVPETEE